MRSILNRISRYFENLENAHISLGSGILSLIAIVLLRNFFESALEGDQVLGFSPSPSHSFMMFFNHFLLFYASLFLWFLLFIHLETREKLGKIARIILFSFFVLFIPPFFDYLMSGGSGYDLGYLSGVEEANLALKLLHPTQEITRVSPGQRIEIFLGCGLVFLYVFSKFRSKHEARSRKILKAIIASMGIYLIILLHGLPQAFAQIPSLLGLDLPRGAILAGGLVEMDSQNYGLFNLFLGGIAGVLLLKRMKDKAQSPKPAEPFLLSNPTSREARRKFVLLTSCTMLTLGVLWGFFAFRSAIGGFVLENPFNYLAFLALVFAFGLVSQSLSGRNGVTLPFQLVVAFLIAVNVGITATFLLFLFLILLWIWSRGGFQTRPYIFAFLSFLFTLLAGFSLFGQKETFLLFLPWAKEEQKAWGHFLSGREYFLRGDYTEAESEYEMAKSLPPFRSPLMKGGNIGGDYDYLLSLRLGDVRYKRGDLTGAIEELEEAVEKEPRRYKVYPLLGSSYLLRGEMERTLALYEKAIQNRVEPGIFFLESGRVLTRLGRVEDALGSIHHAFLLRAPRGLCYQALGDLAAKKGEFEEAIENYDRALRYDPRNALNYTGRGNVFFERHQYAEAEREYQKALALSPNDGTVQNNLGGVYFQINQLEKAEEAFRRAIQISPSLVEGYYNLGMTYERKGLVEKAEEHYRRALEINPRYERAALALKEIKDSK